MDENGRNLADSYGDMVPPNAPNAAAELRKRRSTRIVQAVPLLVTGVDALGRPFQERTSSLIINCHGCRYQSKHYVLKNMWVTLEIPHPEAGQPPRIVRGRVAWIQRPRTVRQLFQVAVELEVPGNVWGIAFPPEDWFSTPDEVAPAIPLPAAEIEGLPETETVPATAAETEQPAGEPPDNLRVFPAPTGTDASLQLARQVTRLLADAKQQIQSAASEAARQAVAEETRASMKEWQARFAAAREEISAEVAGALERLQNESEMSARAAQGAAAEALQKDLPGWLLPQMETLTRDLTERLRQEGAAHAATQEQTAKSAAEMLQDATKHAEECAEKLLATASQSEALMAARLEAARRSLEDAARQPEEAAAQTQLSVARSAEETRHQLHESLKSAEASWRERLAMSLGEAQAQLQQTLENALKSAAEQSFRALEERTAAAQSRIEEEAGRQAGGLGERAAAITRESENRLTALREGVESSAQHMEASLAAAGQSATQLEQFSSRLQAMQREEQEKFHAHLEDLLGRQREELQRRSEALVENAGQRVHSAFEDSSREAAQRFEEQVRSLMQPHIAGAQEAVHRLAGGRSLLDAAMTLQEDRVRSMTEEAFGEALARFREHLGSVEKELHESAQTIVARNLADFEAKTGDIQHSTVESLYKSAEWYEKKAQTQLQQMLERGVEQTGQQLRERAGEISGVFTTELDHRSRNFMDHAHGQMEELLRESFERARALFTEAAETTSAAFTDEIQRNARQELDGFSEVLQKTIEDSRVQAEEVRREAGAQMTAEQEAFLRRFESSMTTALETGVAAAQQQVQGGLQQVVESWRAMALEHQEKLREMYGHIGDQSVEKFRGRLENVSNSWMLATVTTLDRQSRDALSGVAQAAEVKLRETCADVFANVGDALRERLKEIASSFAPPESAKHVR
jgi:hypothetical protein